MVSRPINCMGEESEGYAEMSNDTTLRIYAYIRSYIEEHGYAPALREVQEYIGHRSINSTQYHMMKLFRAGLLETDIPSDKLYPRAYRLARQNPLGD